MTDDVISAKYRKGFSPLAVVAVLAILGLAGGGAFFFLSDDPSIGIVGTIQREIDKLLRPNLNFRAGSQIPRDSASPVTSAQVPLDRAPLNLGDVSSSPAPATSAPVPATPETSTSTIAGSRPIAPVPTPPTSVATTPPTPPTPATLAVTPSTNVPTPVTTPPTPVTAPPTSTATPPTSVATPATGSSSVAPTPPSSSSGRFTLTPPAGCVSPVLVTEPRSSTPPARAPENNVDRAMAQSSPPSGLTPQQRASLPASGGSVDIRPMPRDAGSREDSVVTSRFVRSLAQWLVSSYRPPVGVARTGFTLATAINANTQFGSSLEGLRHASSSPDSGRADVLQYVYTAGMLDALYRMYVDSFIKTMLEASLERRPGGLPALTDAQAVDMFRVYADFFRQLSAALRGVAAQRDLHAQLARVRQSGQDLVKANNDFAELLLAYEEARDAGRRTDADRVGARLRECAANIEKATQIRMQSRVALTDAIKRQAGGRTVADDTLVYLAEWVDRRGNFAKAAPATSMAAEILIRLADQCDAQAEMIRTGGVR